MIWIQVDGDELASDVECGVLGRQMGPDSLLISDGLISRMMIDECCCTEGKTGTTALI